ncbi:hypothetical protein SLEP1_g55778 [Rubroshorea leprosula]|uniref:Reverse transcriptase Ty1/copia-type domain-containing protein n=1 Tax=Rubroshorea leprosula TaxID=152421 RepID=A0AAV5MIM4_9ROSI|nr:hypothetical protein SLEP1_g55778 [Rubroshorea leprosula]
MNGLVQISVPILDGKNYNRWCVQMRHAYRESKKKDKKALYFIHQGANDEVFEKIDDAATSKQAWDTLMTTYKGAEKVNKVKLQTLRCQYELLQMESFETVATYINRVLALTNKSKVYGEEYNEQGKVEKILRTLTPKFEPIMAAIEEAHDLSQMIVDELSGSLEAHEQRMNGKQIEKPIEQAFQSKVSIKGDQGGETSQKHGGSHGKRRGRGRGFYFNKGRGGHNNNYGVGGNDQEKSNFSYQQNSRGRGHGRGRELFVDLDESFRTKVKFSDDRTIPVTGKGRILINLKNGDHKYISDVFYVPGMKSNLLSVGQLLEKLYVMSLCDHQFSILDKQGQMVKGLPSIHNPDQLCEACILGKHHRMPFAAKQQQRATQPLELVHSDVCGPMNTTSNGYNRNVQNITSVKAWSGFKPSVKHLKVFGFVAYAHIPAKTRTKLDDRVEKIIFIGYKHGGYKLFNPETKKKPLQALLKKPPHRKPKENLQGHNDNVDANHHEPMTFEEAIQDFRWVNVMNEEIKAIERNNTWVLTDIPQAHKAIDVKWVFKTKVKSNGKVERYKARLVAKGFEQRLGYDFQEVFSPITRMETIRLIAGLAAQNQWKVHQMDVKSAFLNGPLEKEVYVKQPPGFMKQGSEDKVYRLKKALYGLKQAPRAWNKRVDSFFLKAGNNPTMIEDFKKSMMGEFNMTDLGLMSYFLGIEVVQRKDGIFICQKRYVAELLKKFHMQNCNCVRTPVEVGTRLLKNGEGAPVDLTYFKQIVGSLRYLTCTRPDISYGVGLISKFMENPQQSHMQVAKRIMRVCYCNIKCMSSNLVAQFNEPDLYSNERTNEVFVDNVSAIDLAKNPITHGRSKHIDVRFHFLRDQVGKKAIELVYCKSENQVADILTKPLKFEAFIKLRSMLGMTALPDQD